MSQSHATKDSALTIELTGEIDHKSAEDIRRMIDLSIAEKRPKKLTLDFSRVTFMDSSGIGLTLNRYRLMKERGGRLIIKNPGAHIDRLFKMSGIYEICPKEAQ